MSFCLILTKIQAFGRDGKAVKDFVQNISIWQEESGHQVSMGKCRTDQLDFIAGFRLQLTKWEEAVFLERQIPQTLFILFGQQQLR